MESATLCFSCGLPVTTPPRLNDMPDGTPCRTCRARALDVVAPALPRPHELPEDEWREEQEADTPFGDQPFDPSGLGDDFPEPA